MKKSLILAAAAIILAGCAKEAVVAPSSDVTGKVTIYKADATFSPVSKMTQTSATDDSGLEFFSLGWEAGDVLKCYDAETGYFVGKATEFEADAVNSANASAGDTVIVETPDGKVNLNAFFLRKIPVDQG